MTLIPRPHAVQKVDDDTLGLHRLDKRENWPMRTCPSKGSACNCPQDVSTPVCLNLTDADWDQWLCG